jgi:hypothetical protein
MWRVVMWPAVVWRAVAVAAVVGSGAGISLGTDWGLTTQVTVVRAQDGDAALSRVGAYVENYYGRTQSVLAEQTVVLQPIGSDFAAQGFPRRLVYELRVEWNPESDEPATVHRELLSAKGPLLGPPKQPDCLDPRSVSPEPLAFLLPARRHKYTFKPAKPDQINGRAVMTFEYRPVAPEPPVVDWREDCGTIDLPGRTAGRIWADALTSEVLRFDEYLVGPVDIPAPRRKNRSFGPDWFTVERSDTSIRYRPVTFADPDETLLLPAEVTTVTVIRNSGVPRLRTTETFTNYRRFVTGSRIVS